MLGQLGKCGCGRDVRYMTGNTFTEGSGSCNKYKRCPEYSDLEKEIIILREANKLLTECSEVFMDYRYGTDTWNKAEAALNRLKELTQ